ncbi:NADH-quinone oxidoreductase subunit N [Pacificitalea manganoxidans]|uniref:NADH-quinone oxidoreductase subunit N n=1 Tax=Pacificitalea manganoxidans TaxID=1411902 RepID=A0A291LYH6_9RHOB|nr:NADH-quinone oxidoreductase subunit NuoN [Pacificitalea manganoxidans]ATI41704.1 NADH-quinone oxidoreductase subunit N [Pacificitalea manganoxidans]MAQ44297.1 NADH-quinone oxidoreductase subunit NuoN [Actibacterium sp.]MBF52562.1 NADH-quinone oxidoreductase subunit NuoN [Actibacterium sp.]MDR6309156.1 NADH-quinone oxidoreductase subunit N [Pacificitalea manganoxidans]|tara:strand:- start:407 stop:1846 length:1440 start_codon:yes stop_codon:yes gene_type:complete
MTSADFTIILPEIALAVYAMAALLFGVYTTKDKAAPLLVWTTSAVLVAVAIWVGLSGEGTQQAFGGLFIDDGFARFAKVVALLSAAVVLVLSMDFMTTRDLLRFEYPILVTLALVGMMVMVSSGNLMTLYMGLELQSLALYVVAALRRDSVKSTEAGLKYFVLGSLSSGMLLYGASLTYGFAGTTQFEGIYLAAGDQLPIGLLFGLVFLLAGLAFKVSAAPFHMWTPDVYEGSPTPITAFFATAPKVAAMALLARVVYGAFGGATADWGQIIAFLAVISMFLGSIAAIGQRDIKRLMAYSSIAHMGYALVGLAAGTTAGVQSMLLYMAIYVTMNIGVFAFILTMERDGRHVTEIGALSMLSKREPIKALAILLLMFSMAGVPPMAGFFAKFAVFSAAVDAGLGWLAVAGAVASAIGLYYYLRIVFLMYFGKDEDAAIDGSMGMIQWGVLMASAAIMLLGVVNLFGVDGLAGAAALTLVN